MLRLTPLMLRRVAPILSLFVATACADVLDIDGIEIGQGQGGTPAIGGGGSTSTANGGSTNSSGGGGTSSTGGMGGVGGVGGASAENCANGIDDNDDSLVDCEDPLCGAFMCAEQAPTNWLGPYASVVAASAAACPSSAPNEIARGGTGSLNAPDATCAPCTCGDPINVVCSMPDVDFFNSEECDDFLGDANANAAGVCEQLGAPGNVDSVRGHSGSQPSDGECTPGGGTPSVPPATFEDEARVCGANAFGGGCDAGSVCMPSPGSPFSDKPCILQKGDHTCPGTPYSQKTLIYEDVTDTRSCSTCSCGDPTGMSCTAVTTVYSDFNCTLGMIEVPHDGSCTETNYGPGSWRFDFTVDGGSCTASSVNATGQATPGEPTTICCMP